jgi:hypothetical protein
MRAPGWTADVHRSTLAVEAAQTSGAAVIDFVSDTEHEEPKEQADPVAQASGKRKAPGLPVEEEPIRSTSPTYAPTQTSRDYVPDKHQPDDDVRVLGGKIWRGKTAGGGNIWELLPADV